MLFASDSDGKDDGTDYHDHDTSEYTHKMVATTGGIDTTTTTTTTTTTLSPPLSSSTSTSISILTDHDFPVDAIIKIVDCLSTKDTIHLSNTCQTLYTKIVIAWGGWECSSASCSTSSSVAVAAAASNSKSRPTRIFHALMEESGRRRHRHFVLSHSSRQQQRREKQMTTMKMMMLQHSNDNDNDDRDNNYCRETATTTAATTTATTTNNKNSFDIDIDIDNSVHIRSSSDIVVGGCHRCQQRTCSDCTKCCMHCTETLCSKGCCCEATDQKMSKCCKCHGSSNVVDGQRTTNVDNTNTTLQQQQQQQQQQQHDIGLSCTDCEKYCDICQLYFCITCTERIIDHSSSISNNNGTSSASKKQAVQTQCGMCFVNKPHGENVIPVGSIHPRNGNYVVVLIVIESSCVIPVSIFVPKNPVKSFIVTVVWNSAHSLSTMWWLQ